MQLRYVDAMRILLTDQPVDAEEALRIGLVNEVVPHEDLLDRAEELLAWAVRVDSEGVVPYLALARLFRTRGEIGRAGPTHG